jgi:hypothetical protein
MIYPTKLVYKAVGSLLAVLLLNANTTIAAAPMRTVEVEVTAAFINSLADLLDERTPYKLLVILDQSRSLDRTSLPKEDLAAQLKKNLPEASDAVVADFLQHGNVIANVKVPTRLILKQFRLEMVSQQRLNEIFAKNFDKEWKGFYKAFPGSSGYLAFSRAGYDEKRGQALLLVDHSCGGLCGSGSVVLMEKKFGVWQYVRKHQIWIN